MERARDELLAGSALAQHERRRVALGQLGQDLEDRLHLRRGAEHAPELGCLLRAPARSPLPVILERFDLTRASLQQTRGGPAVAVVEQGHRTRRAVELGIVGGQDAQPLCDRPAVG